MSLRVYIFSVFTWFYITAEVLILKINITVLLFVAMQRIDQNVFPEAFKINLTPNRMTTS